MQITLIDPLMDYRAHCVSETLGLMYVAAVLREAGHGVQIVATGLRPGKSLAPEDIRDADLVGITATSALFGNATEVLGTIRAWRPELPVVLGGAHATICTASTLEAGFDYAILGEAERTIAMKLCQYGEILPQVLCDYRPNLLASYLYELAQNFHSFYEQCPVLNAGEPARSTRIALCDTTSRILRHGLNLLGISPPERM